MKYSQIHICLDCEYTGPLHHVAGISQCPQCASRSVWPVSAWSKSPAAIKLPFHEPKAKLKPTVTTCCELTPSFFGGCLGYH